MSDLVNPFSEQPNEERTPGCVSSPCGLNAECRVESGDRNCFCPPTYIGDPLVSCRPECLLNSECSREKSCIRNRCENPCVDACGPNSECRVANHAPVCVCREGFSGNPFSFCSPIPVEAVIANPIDRVDVCDPNPCGTNAECQSINNNVLCVCLPGLQGNPNIACKPECTTNSECSNSLACIAQNCRDPCAGSCGVNARCQVVGHNPVCTCPLGYTGDPFVQCQIRPTTTVVEKPECEVDPDCPPSLACIQQRCKNPCTDRPGVCAPNALCRVAQHRPVCVCPEGLSGNPQIQCLTGNIIFQFHALYLMITMSDFVHL